MTQLECLAGSGQEQLQSTPHSPGFSATDYLIIDPQYVADLAEAVCPGRWASEKMVSDQALWPA